MTTIDFNKWAQDYEDEAARIGEKVKKNRITASNFMLPADDRLVAERNIRMLENMRLDCLKTAAILREKAKNNEH